MKRRLDTGSLAVSAITLVLFVVALFTKGLTHDLLLESGVFLVSVKIIMLAHHNRVAVDRLDDKLDRILASMESGRGETGHAAPVTTERRHEVTPR